MDNRQRFLPPLIAMTTWMRKLFLLVALLVLPLQGMAMAATFVKCHEQAAAQASAHAHEHHQHGDGADHHPSGDEGTPASFASHLCGHHFALHVPASLNIVPSSAFAAWSLPAPLSYTPHFPEHPRRPPRA
ncbi:MAG: hypothetical protein ACXW2I_06200 [Burkholderiales bacterium]